MDRLTDSDYYGEIRQLARDLFTEEDSRDLSERVTENIDGHRWVIYYAYALDVLRISRNSDALFDSLGDDACNGVSSLGELHSRAAYFALEADLWAEIYENWADDLTILENGDDPDDLDDVARWDVVQGWYWGLTWGHHGQGSPAYARLCRLRRIYTPKPSEDMPETAAGRCIARRVMREAK